MSSSTLTGAESATDRDAHKPALEETAASTSIGKEIEASKIDATGTVDLNDAEGVTGGAAAGDVHKNGKVEPEKSSGVASALSNWLASWSEGTPADSFISAKAPESNHQVGSSCITAPCHPAATNQYVQYWRDVPTH